LILPEIIDFAGNMTPKAGPENDVKSALEMALIQPMPEMTRC